MNEDEPQQENTVMSPLHFYRQQMVVSIDTEQQSPAQDPVK
jgi:hypothetical protein